VIAGETNMSLEMDLFEITVRSIAVSGSATLLAGLWGIPLGIFIGLKKFYGRSLAKGFFNAMLGMPTVSLGLILYLLFSRAGSLGFLHLLYTPFAVLLGQSILITPIIVSFVASAIESVDPEIRDLAKTLGASETQASITVLSESMSGVLLAVIASFNRAISELGVALMLGGNLRNLTRVMTTAISLETARGELDLGISLTVILLSIVFVLNFLTNLVQRRWRS
jgi:tungstate transport system permease protein